MDVPKRLWDSNVVLSYLCGDPAVKPVCDLIIKQAERGEIELRVSAMTQAEVAYLPDYSDSESENIVREFFSHSYVLTILYDIEVAREARRLIRKYKSNPPVLTPFCPNCHRRMPLPELKPPDAVHMATALLWHIPILETTDPDLLNHNGKEGNPPLVIREPLYEGMIPLLPTT